MQTLIVAATDTTAVTLTWAIALLLNNPEVLKKARDEIDIQVGTERPVNESDMRNLVYLQAIIKETMRLYPAGPLLLPHESIEECIVKVSLTCYITLYYLTFGKLLLTVLC